MMFVVTSRVTLALGLSSSRCAFAQSSLEWLDCGEGASSCYARDVSDDGTVVVGQVVSPEGAEACKWSDGSFSRLGDLPGGPLASDALAVGGAIVGFGTDASGTKYAVRFSGSPQIISHRQGTEARGVSADGSVVVGVQPEHAVKFRPEYELLAGGEANDVSADGSIIVGQNESCRGVGVWDFDSPPGGWCLWERGTATAITADGRTLVGYFKGISSSGGRAFRNGQLLSTGGNFALAVSGDGSVVVGAVGESLTNPDAAFIWTEGTGMRDLKTVLEDDYCLELGGAELLSATGISLDGTVIVGDGKRDGFMQPWIARIPAPAITWSDPPDGLVDSRQDLSSTGTRYVGLDRVRLSFSTAVQDLSTSGPLGPQSFEIEDGACSPPAILEVNLVNETSHSYDVILEDPITPGVWTTITPRISRVDGILFTPLPCAHVRIGFLPADANSDLASTARDILAIIDHLNGVYSPPMAIWQCDQNRSGVCNAGDILRLIDLLNGSNSSRPWLGERLPDRP